MEIETWENITAKVIKNQASKDILGNISKCSSYLNQSDLAYKYIEAVLSRTEKNSEG